MASRTPLHPDAAHNLALTMVACSEAPLLLLDGDLTVIAASDSFCRSFQIDPAGVADRPVFELGLALDPCLLHWSPPHVPVQRMAFGSAT